MNDRYVKLYRAFVFMNLMDAFHDHDHVYLGNIEHDEYSTLLDEDKKHVLKQLKSEIDQCKLDPIGMSMLLDFIKRYDTNDNMEDIGL